MLLLFIIGFIDMVIISAWTKLVSDNKIMASGVVTVINIVTWYYVLQTILEDMGNWRLIAVYAIGCGLGTMLSTYYFQSKAKKQEKASFVGAPASQEI